MNMPIAVPKALTYSLRNLGEGATGTCCSQALMLSASRCTIVPLRQVTSPQLMSLHTHVTTTIDPPMGNLYQ